MITVVDYGRGNLFSIGQALRHLGHDFVLAKDPELIHKADKVILPGVGAFGDAMARLEQSGMDQALRDVARSGKVMVGICLGMQLLADRSEEFGSHHGLGLVQGEVKPLPTGNERIPNIGWRRLVTVGKDHGFTQFGGEYFYFVHSFHLVCENPADVAADIVVNGENITAAIWRDNIRATQFHPEKSGPLGLQMLSRMLSD